MSFAGTHISRRPGKLERGWKLDHWLEIASDDKFVEEKHGSLTKIVWNVFFVLTSDRKLTVKVMLFELCPE